MALTKEQVKEAFREVAMREYEDIPPKEEIKHIIRVHHPELSPEEFERRMNQIKRAAIDLLIAAEKAK